MNDDEILGWHLKPTCECVRKYPSVSKVRMLIITDSQRRKQMDFKVFSKKGRFVIKRLEENKLVTYEGRPFTFKTKDEAEKIVFALLTGNKHMIVGMNYYYYSIK
jgi:hypothetical protein